MRSRTRIDFLLLAPVVMLIVISLATLLSVQESFFRSQLLSVVIAGAAFVFFAHVRVEALRQLKLPIYLISIVLLTIVLLLGIESRGAVRWLSVLGVTVQFSEIL